MPKTATLTIRLDPTLKQQTEKLLRDMGLTPSQAITLFYKQVSLQHGLPFQVSLPNDETLQAIDDLKNRRNVKTFSSVSDLAADLES